MRRTRQAFAGQKTKENINTSTSKWCLVPSLCLVCCGLQGPIPTVSMELRVVSMYAVISVKIHLVSDFFELCFCSLLTISCTVWHQNLGSLYIKL